MRRLLLIALAAVSVLGAIAVFPRLHPDSNTGPTTVTPPPPANGGPLTFTIRPVRHAVNADGDTIDVVMEITAPRGDARRAPVDFALVLDRSGSMEGDPLQNALEAARKLVGRLGEDDRLAIVEFGSDVKVSMPLRAMDGAGREAATRALSAIASDGGTNMGDALRVAHEALRSASVTPGRVRRIVMLSDGQANEGPVGPALVELARTAGGDGVRVSALGLGVDFDEDQLLSIADAGGGQYRFLRNDDALAAALNAELSQAATTAASAVSVTVFDRNGPSSVEQVYGYATQETKGGRHLTLADIAAGETRRIVARLRVRAGEAGVRELVSARLSYIRPDATQGTVSAGSDATAQVTFTRDAGKIAGSWSKEAAEAGIRARWGAVLYESGDLYAKDDADGAAEKRKAGLAELLSEASASGNAAIVGDLNREDEEADKAFAAPAASTEGRAAAKEFKARGIAAAR